MPVYPLTAEMLSAILEATRIENEPMKRALHDHLVLGHSVTAAAERYGYKKQQVFVHAKAIEEKLKPAFDRYASAALAETRGSVAHSKDRKEHR
ncbi:hypothetical protein [Burkholderia gladioli]|uniref:hypothetical protein n=1 Tax=Burkholderia gladioli TaxID=28095 RepID=UPI001641EA32|nr:hypothetical protein [Burkholderia gladioli]